MKKTIHAPANAITMPDYWESIWAHPDVPNAIDPHDVAPENHFYKVLHELFTRALGASCLPGAKLIEIGCGGSRWLPYFHREFGFDIYGIDYTMTGTRLSRLILEKAGVHGCVVQGDLFEPPSDWIEKFDVVASFGLVEHFENTPEIISACARYLRPGGELITLVPTMRGLYGLCYRLFRPDIYRKHIPHSRETLAEAHAAAGMNVKHSSYVLGFPGIVNASASRGFAGRVLLTASRAYWRLERSGFGIPPNRFSSPYVLCSATKRL